MTDTDSFEWVNKQTVRNSRGYVVKSIDRFTMKYIETEKSITVNVEYGYLPCMKPCVTIEHSAFLHFDNAKTILPTVEQVRIEENFTNAIKFMGMEVVKSEDGGVEYR
jgi:hypothetical protein